MYHVQYDIPLSMLKIKQYSRQMKLRYVLLSRTHVNVAPTSERYCHRRALWTQLP